MKQEFTIIVTAQAQPKLVSWSIWNSPVHYARVHDVDVGQGTTYENGGQQRCTCSLASVQVKVISFSPGPIPEWTVREQLILASAVQRSGDQNWYKKERVTGYIVYKVHSVQGVSQQSCETSRGRCKTSRLLLPKGTYIFPSD